MSSIEEKDDSFDAEFSLLESTLTEFKDKEHQPDEKNMDKNKPTPTNNIEEEGKGSTVKSVLGKEVSTNESADNIVSSIPLSYELINVQENIVNSLGIPGKKLISSTTRHLSSEITTGLSNNLDCSLDTPVNEPKLTVSSNYRNENNHNIHLNSLTHEDQQHSSQPDDQTGNDLIQCLKPTVALESNESEILNLDCSPIPSPNPPNPGDVVKLNDECGVLKSDQKQVQMDSQEVIPCNLDDNLKTIISKKIAGTDIKLLSIVGESQGRSNIFCSTPVAASKDSCPQTQIISLHKQYDSISDGREESPISTSCGDMKKTLKRKNLGLECIEEVDEDAPDIYSTKKLKVVDSSIEHFDSEAANNQDMSSMPCFEPPAKSILKKWQLGSLSRNSGSSTFLVLDECNGSDLEDVAKHSEEVSEPASADDFEIACKLTEELIKSSSNTESLAKHHSNIETLEKYYSQVQLESQMDDDKFDEVLQELTLNYELDEKTFLSHKAMEESVLTETNKTSLSVKSMEESVLTEANKTSLSVKSMKESDLLVGREQLDEESLDSTLKLELKKPNSLVESLVSNTPDTFVERKKDFVKEILLPIPSSDSTNDENFTVKVKDDIQPETFKSNKTDEVPDCSDKKLVSEQTSKSEKVLTLCADGKDMTLDEEDVLLEEDVSTRKKPYVFFEFVSSDPKENEDNYNPEWQKLGRLTSDEERYKAVRDRWRSLVPPDPNIDLTCRQWRAKNHKPPLNFPSLSSNHQTHADSERNQLCTAVFDIKIKKMLHDLENRRMNIVHHRNMDFQDLGLAQDEEQRLLSRRCGSDTDMMRLRKHHLEECRELKDKHDRLLKQVTNETEANIRVLKDASEEVLLFQKFYKGVGADDDEVCLYSTDEQVQELLETEDMLEQYTKFYQ